MTNFTREMVETIQSQLIIAELDGRYHPEITVLQSVGSTDLKIGLSALAVDHSVYIIPLTTSTLFDATVDISDHILTRTRDIITASKSSTIIVWMGLDYLLLNVKMEI